MCVYTTRCTYLLRSYVCVGTGRLGSIATPFGKFWSANSGFSHTVGEAGVSQRCFFGWSRCLGNALAEAGEGLESTSTDDLRLDWRFLARRRHRALLGGFSRSPLTSLLVWPSKLRVADFISHRGSTWASRVSAVEFSSLSVSVSVAAVSLSSVSLDSYNRIGTASTARPIAKAAPGIFLFLFRKIFKRKWNRDAPSPYQGYLPKVPMPRGNEGTKQKQYGKVDANQIRCNARSLRQYQGPSRTLPSFPFLNCVILHLADLFGTFCFFSSPLSGRDRICRKSKTF